MKNLDQIRAKNALEAAAEAAKDENSKGVNNGEVVKKVPAMIQQNGLLGALAFAIDKGKGYAFMLNACIKHYNSLPNVMKANATDLEGFSKWLCGQDSAQLRAVTTEILAYLNYLRRYVKKEGGNENGN